MAKIMGIDPGTMFLQFAEKIDKEILIKVVRNSFIELDASGSEDIETILSQNNWQYIKDGNKYYVTGENSLTISKFFPGKAELRRPMQDGVLNKGEDKKIIVMSKMIEDIIGRATDKESMVCFCVSSESIDNDVDNAFHAARIEGMIQRLGYNTKKIEEGLAVILAEKPIMIEEDGTESPYSGIGISFGAGKTNCVLAYKGLSVIGMSVTRGGDFIDKKVAEQTNTPVAQVIGIKETKLDFDNVDHNNDVIFALSIYYSNLIEHVFKNFAKKFAQVKSQFETPLDIVVAGGTSMPKGFRNKVETIVRGLDLPFKIKEIKQSKDPRNSVVKGCLVQAIISQKKLGEEKINKMLEE